ncbi:Hsp70 family protein [Aeromicrobium sp. CF4.19]|uniref:Hsp70 family protein n=1 Tax=Aeromicrobium sp. CF4.19 TaxID=3373082 RepID=UPI003EE59F62
MIGIDVGSTTVTLSHEAGVESRPHQAPPELVCRVGDDVPCVLLSENGFALRQAHEVFAGVVADAVRAHRSGDGRGGSTAPAAVAVPGWWTPRALGWVGGALDAAGLGDVLLINDGEAGVLGHRAAGGSLPDTVAVVDLGAEVASVVIVERCTERPSAVPSPALVHVEGGDRLDGAVLHHLVGGLADLGVAVDREDPETVLAARKALDQCRGVREALSLGAVESVQPELPGADRRLRLVRSELEELAAPWAESVIRMVATAVDQYPGRVEGVLLVGGLAAMPLVSQRLSADLGLEVVVADAPVEVVARGAATRAVAPVQPTPRKTWRRKAPQAALPAGRRRERGRRRKDGEHELVTPALAALPVGGSATSDTDGPERAGGDGAAAGQESVMVSQRRVDVPGSPAALPAGSHMDAMVVPADVSAVQIDEPGSDVPIADPAAAIAGGR